MKLSMLVPGYDIPESLVFAHSTKMHDAWMALPERIVTPATRVEPFVLTIKVADRNTGELGYLRPTRNPIRLLKRRRTIDMSGRFIYDARYQIDSNMGHYLIVTVARILAARRRLSEELGEDVVIHTILRERPLSMAIQVFEALDLPVIATEANVTGRVVTVGSKDPVVRSNGRFQDREHLCGLIPELYKGIRRTLQLEGPAFDKIFISRKTSRRVENEQEISDLLASRGFHKVYFESDELSVLDQWRIIAKAREIVAIHGAGLTSMALNPHGLDRPEGDLSGLRVTELFGAGYFVPFNRELAASLNASWRGVRGRITPKIVRDMDFRGGGRVHQASSFRVDPKALELALEESAVNCSTAEA